MKKQFFKITIWSGIATAMLSLAELFYLVIFSKLLGAEGYGLWITYFTFIQLLVPIAMLGLNFTLPRYLTAAKSKPALSNNFFISMFFVLISSLVFLGIIVVSKSFLINTFFDNSQAGLKLLEWGSALVVATALELIGLSYFISSMRLKKYAIYVIIRNVLEIGLCFFLAKSKYPLHYIALSFIIIRLGIFASLFREIFSEIGLHLSSLKFLKKYLKYGIPLIMSAFFAWMVKISNRLIISYILDVKSVGIFAAAYNISNIILIFAITLQNSLYPTISFLWNKNKKDEALALIATSIKYFLLIAIPIGVILSVFAKDLLQIATHSEFLEQGGNIIPLASLGIIFYGLFTFMQFILTSVKRTYLISLTLGISGALNIALNFILIKYINILGAAVATLLTFIISFILVTLISKKFAKVKVNYMALLKYIGAGLVLFGLLLLSKGRINFILSSIIGFSIYSAIVYALNGIPKKELLDLIKYIRKKPVSSKN